MQETVCKGIAVSARCIVVGALYGSITRFLIAPKNIVADGVGTGGGRKSTAVAGCRITRQGVVGKRSGSKGHENTPTVSAACTIAGQGIVDNGVVDAALGINTPACKSGISRQGAGSYCVGAVLYIHAAPLVACQIARQGIIGECIGTVDDENTTAIVSANVISINR